MNLLSVARDYTDLGRHAHLVPAETFLARKVAMETAILTGTPETREEAAIQVRLAAGLLGAALGADDHPAITALRCAADAVERLK